MSLEVGDPEDMDEGLTATLNFTTIDNRECARVAGSAHTQARVSRALLPRRPASASFQEMSLPAGIGSVMTVDFIQRSDADGEFANAVCSPRRVSFGDARLCLTTRSRDSFGGRANDHSRDRRAFQGRAREAALLPQLERSVARALRSALAWVPKPFSHHRSPSGREPQRSRQRACRAIGAVPEAGVEYRLPSEEAARPRFRLCGAPRRPHVRVPMLAPSDG